MNSAVFHPNGLVQWHAEHLYRKRFMPDTLRAMNIEKAFGPKLAYLAQWGKEHDEHWQNVDAEEQFQANVLYARPQGFDNALSADPGDDINQDFTPDMSYSLQPDGSLHYNGMDSKRIAQTLLTTRDMYTNLVDQSNDAEDVPPAPAEPTPKKKKRDHLQSIEKTDQTPEQA